MQSLPVSFFDRHPLIVARALLGHWVVHESPAGKMIGRIVETEAYRWDEPGCHAWKNVHPNGQLRDPELISAGLFDAPGTSYVYISYGMHWMLNVVCEAEGIGAGVLIRAVEPIEGLDLMRQNRGNPKREVDLTNGPGKLCQALGIRDVHHRRPLQQPPLSLVRPPMMAMASIGVSTRIGLTTGADLPWRFFEQQNRWVSKGKVSLVCN